MGYGSGGGLYLTVETDIPKGIHLWLAGKTLMRLGDNFAGSSCRYYHAKTVKSDSGIFLAGGNDKEKFYDKLNEDSSLKNALGELIHTYGFDELQLADGRCTARKKYLRGDAEAGRIKDLLEKVTLIAGRFRQPERAD